ncbi:spore coat protein [Halalkalibacter akibai]|uniref:Spore coat F-containing protein n=1 Tax=Halalkalibacter akibai (strain ATCC 43226 / DSM 21942 / CIP 109018 / JCM 9157 / 1139) TaxID=1236973 RepID=W4QM80_HALA3|nr:spore coat protein [Halalkalibacter akibai]GAE33206.1 spore coat F-containing protein [Halalkalibacter akibai JCM 9157]
MNQQSKKIQNPELQVPKTPQMNDRDFINDILMCAKNMTNSYSVALNELSHDQLYQDVNQIFNETQNCQRELYNVMFRKGFYGLEAAEQQKLDQSYQQFSGYSSQFPYQQ